MPTTFPEIKVAITGSHGTGKTTLVNELGLYWDIPVIHERARQFGDEGFDLNHDATFETQLLMMLGQLADEDGLFGRSALISDRTIVDYLAYIYHSHHRPNKQVLDSIEASVYHLLNPGMRRRYDYVFYLPADSLPLVGDDLRPQDVRYQLDIDATLRAYYKRYGIDLYEVQSVDLTDRKEEITAVIREHYPDIRVGKWMHS